MESLIGPAVQMWIKAAIFEVDRLNLSPTHLKCQPAPLLGLSKNSLFYLLAMHKPVVGLGLILAVAALEFHSFIKKKNIKSCILKFPREFVSFPEAKETLQLKQTNSKHFKDIIHLI